MKALTQVRNDRGWSQQRLADESGVNKATINQIERGRRSPNVETLEKLAAGLDVEMADFFPREGAPGQRPSSKPSSEEAGAYGDDYFYGDEPLSGMEFTEYLFRLEDLVNQWVRTVVFYSHPERPSDPSVEKLHLDWDTYRLEETCRAFVQYLEELRAGSDPRDDRAAPDLAPDEESFEEARVEELRGNP